MDRSASSARSGATPAFRPSPSSSPRPRSTESASWAPTGYEDIVQWYDLLRYRATRYVGPSYPVCVGGASSSGHIALLLAVVRRPACIVTEAAPTDLSALKGSASNRAYKVAVEAFGPSGLGRWSPASYASPPYFGLPIALGHLPDDQLVPASQMTSFAVGRPAVRSFTATPTGGATPPPECANYDLYLQRSFAHLCYAGQLGITRTSFDRWRTLEVSVVESALAKRQSSPGLSRASPLDAPAQ